MLLEASGNSHETDKQALLKFPRRNKFCCLHGTTRPLSADGQGLPVATNTRELLVCTSEDSNWVE